MHHCIQIVVSAVGTSLWQQFLAIANADTGQIQASRDSSEEHFTGVPTGMNKLVNGGQTGKEIGLLKINIPKAHSFQ